MLYPNNGNSDIKVLNISCGFYFHQIFTSLGHLSRSHGTLKTETLVLAVHGLCDTVSGPITHAVTAP